MNDWQVRHISREPARPCSMAVMALAPASHTASSHAPYRWSCRMLGQVTHSDSDIL